MSGRPAPGATLDFTLVDLNGDDVRLSDFRDKQHVVLVLLRGLR